MLNQRLEDWILVNQYLLFMYKITFYMVVELEKESIIYIFVNSELYFLP